MPFPPARPLIAASLLALAMLPAHAQKKGGTLTYTYHPEPTAMSTISTTAVPVALIATKIYESLLEYEGAGHEAGAGARRVVDRLEGPARPTPSSCARASPGTTASRSPART